MGSFTTRVSASKGTLILKLSCYSESLSASIYLNLIVLSLRYDDIALIYYPCLNNNYLPAISLFDAHDRFKSVAAWWARRFILLRGLYLFLL